MTLPTFDALQFCPRDYAFKPYVDAHNWIGGRFVAASTGETLAVLNPRYNRPLGHVDLSGAADVQAAVAAAQAALPAWKATPIKERVQILYRLKALMERDMDELAWLLAHENGKVHAQAIASIAKGIECIEFGASLANSDPGERMQVSRGVHCQVSQEPLGVVAGIVPFNFPMMVPLWMVPNALAAGNTFIIKPSEQVPYCVTRLAAWLQEAGLPDGVFNVVQGGRAAVEAIVEHPAIKAVGFVGSSEVAQLVYARGAALGKRMLCLGGAKNHLLVVPDADLEITAANVAGSAFGTAGQRCMAAAVLVAVGDVQHIIDAIAAEARAITLGDGMGPVVSPAARDRIVGYIDDAERRGATILVDGRGASVPGLPEGNWVGPTVIDFASADMPAACEEIFGPVLTIVRVGTVDEALAIENNNPYGNAASIYTTSGYVAEYCVERFEAGMCGVNIGVPVPREPFAFGGWNGSKFGHGDLTGRDGFHFWTRPRKVTSKWALQADANWMS